MQIGVKILIGTSVVTAVTLGLSSVGLFTKKERQPKIYIQHIYYYYPKANFYYDSSVARYIVWDTATTTWKNTSHLPVLQADMGRSVRIGNSPQPVWKDNQHHKMIYAVALYSSRNDWRQNVREAVSKRTKSSTATRSQKDEKKSGIRRFFERLFS